MSSPSELSEVMAKRDVAVEELTPFLESVLRHDPAVPTVPPKLAGVQGLFTDAFGVLGTFSDPAWKMYKRIWGVTWDKEGQFVGEPAVIANGGRDYVYRPGEPVFGFVRSNGETIVPGPMVTDGGSIPRVCWALPGLDPWTYMPAFLIHDHEFMAHHCVEGYSKSFEDVNDTLAEGVYTLMKSGRVPEDWRVVVAIKTGVDSFVGRKVWGREWSPDQCSTCLKPQGAH